MNFQWIFKILSSIFIFLCLQFAELNAGIVPNSTLKKTSRIEGSSKNFVKKIKNKIIKRLESPSKSLGKFKKFLVENGFGKFIAILFFFIPGSIAHITSFVMLLSTLSKTAENLYFVGVVVSVCATLWCFLGSLIAGKSWRKETATVLIAAPAMIILIIACIQLFSIIFGASGTNFVYGLLSIVLAALVMLFAELLGF